MPDTLNESETKRRRRTDAGLTTRKASSAPAAGGKIPKRHVTEGKGVGKKKAMGETTTRASSRLKRAGETILPRKARGADDRVRLTFVQKAQALDLLKTMPAAAVAYRLGIGASTLSRWKKHEEGIRKRAEASKPGAKSTKGADFPEVCEPV